MVRLLGPFAIVPAQDDGGRQPDAGPVTVSRKGQALLAFLGAQPDARWPRDRLAAMLWPDLADAPARNNLRQLLLHTQRQLDLRRDGRSMLSADRHTIGFAPDGTYQVDVAMLAHAEADCPAAARAPEPSRCTACIERMAAAVSYYRGDFLAGLELDECPQFADWLAGQRQIHLRRALALLERLTLCCEQLGEYSRALAFAQRAVDLEPWNEESHRGAMRAAARGGQRATALGLYDTLRRQLTAELGTEPEAATQALARAIQEGTLDAAPDTAGPPTRPPPPHATARRQVTVLHCQLDPDSPTDPEENLDTVHGPLMRLSNVIEAHFGHVLRPHQGGLLAYFGYPLAQEHAALNAVRAALGIVSQCPAGLSARLGIHTGLMLAGSDPAFPDMAGQVSARSMRLCAMASPGEILLSDGTQHLVADYVDSEPRDHAAGSGAAASVFRLAGHRIADHRLDGTRPLAPLRGRDQELARLEAAWQSACRGAPAAMLLRGEPGIGKSRLVLELSRRLAVPAATSSNNAAPRVLDMRCVQECRQTPFHPVIHLCTRRFGFRSGDTPQTQFARLARALATADGSHPLIPLLAMLLGLPIAPPYRPSPLTPQQRREHTITALLDRLSMLSAAQPLVVVVEDLHWIDPTSLQVLTRLLDAQMPVLVVMTARPEFQPPWPADQVPQLDLGRLSQEDIEQIAQASAQHICPTRLSGIARRADGIPLFAEELAKDALSEADAPVPATLQDLLAARLDALGPDKALAQLMATIGGLVPLSMIEVLCPASEPTILDVLAQLNRAGLVQGTPEDGYEFRHALFKDAVYASQTHADRRSTHRRIAETLESTFPKVAATRPEAIARHWAEAGEPGVAARRYADAARLAQANSAHREALNHAVTGLSLHASLDDSASRMDECELRLQVCRGVAAYAVEGYASPQGWSAYERALVLSEQVGATRESFAALWGLWASTSSHFSWTRSLALADRLLHMARRARDPVHAQQAHFAVGNIQFWRGAFGRSRTHLRKAMSLYQPDHHGALVADFGESAYVTSAAYLSWCLCQLGELDDARRMGQQAVDAARQLDHAYSLGYALTFQAVLFRMLGEPDAALAVADETIALAHTHDFPLWRTGASIIRGWARTVRGEPTGIDEMHEGLDTIRSVMSGIIVICLHTLADGLLHAGRPQAALDAIEEAQANALRLDDHHADSALLHLKGQCLLALNEDSAPAAECFRRALAIAQAQGARHPAQRAAQALADLPAPADTAQAS